jgi:hypothetical protein
MNTVVDAIAEKFKEFDLENPIVYTEIVKLVTAAHDSGVKRLGIATIFEVMRYNMAVRTTGDQYKLNNNFRAMYVRKLISEYPQFTDMFETRQRISVE